MNLSGKFTREARPLLAGCDLRKGSGTPELYLWTRGFRNLTSLTVRYLLRAKLKVISITYFDDLRGREGPAVLLIIISREPFSTWHLPLILWVEKEVYAISRK